MFNMILNSSAFVWIFCTGWLLLPLLVGLWHWSHVGADRTHVCHRLLGDQHYFHHYQYHNGFWLSPDFTYFGEALTVPLFSVVLEIVGVEYLFLCAFNNGSLWWSYRWLSWSKQRERPQTRCNIHPWIKETHPWKGKPTETNLCPPSFHRGHSWLWHRWLW